MDQHIKTLSSKSVYKNKFVDIKVDTIECDSKTWEQVYFVKPNENAAGALAINSDGIYLVKQFRYPSNQSLWQIPMGGIDIGKDALTTIKEELSQEAGLEAETFTNIGCIIPEPGMSSQKILIFVAENLKKVASTPELTEVGMQT